VRWVRSNRKSSCEDHLRSLNATDPTGFSRDGNRLWVSSDGQRAYVGTAHDVEVWPRTIQPLGCA
jgi:hypothetical protein